MLLLVCLWRPEVYLWSHSFFMNLLLCFWDSLCIELQGFSPLLGFQALATTVGFFLGWVWTNSGPHTLYNKYFTNRATAYSYMAHSARRFPPLGVKIVILLLLYSRIMPNTLHAFFISSVHFYREIFLSPFPHFITQKPWGTEVLFCKRLGYLIYCGSAKW